MMIERTMWFLLPFVAAAIIQIEALTAEAETNYDQCLQQYGYHRSVIIDKLFYTNAIRTFQRQNQLPETGELDENTKSYMDQVGCNDWNLDNVGSIGGFAVKKAVSVDACKPHIWTKKNLKWFIEAYPKKQKDLGSPENIRQIFAQSFRDWEQHSALKFQMTSSKATADLKILFISGDDDKVRIFNDGSLLSIGYLPPIGKILFNDDKNFTNVYNSSDGQHTLRLVATHDIGHALGLMHSFDLNSIMFPSYQQFPSNFTLSKTDQAAIQELYGKPKKPHKRTNLHPRTA